MTEFDWLTLILWLVLIMISYGMIRNPIIRGSGALIGFYFSISLAEESIPVMLILFVLNIYFLYTALLQELK